MLSGVDAAVLALVAAGIVLAARSLFRRRKNGGCAGCPGCCPGCSRQTGIDGNQKQCGTE